MNVAIIQGAMDGPVVDFSHGRLRVSGDGHSLMHADGAYFFYLGDTAWELFHRTTREEADLYLANRAAKGFSVIQAVVLAELDGLHTPNAYGDLPLIADNPEMINESYFAYVDYIVRKAREHGMFIGMLPTWGDKVYLAWGKGPVIFNAANARAYGRILGARYKNDPNIIWILGGDRNPNGYEEVWRAMAAGLKEGDGGSHLMTYHPGGGHSSSEWLQKDSWIDFQMAQSGHSARDIPNYNFVANDYALLPAKPALDGESRYEDHPVDWKPAELGWFDARDVRQAAYWAVFAGALGHTYGCHDIWQMLLPGREPVGHARGNWRVSLDLEGAGEMSHLKALMLSRPFRTRVPDQSLIIGPAGPAPSGPDHVSSMRASNYAFVYVPTGKPVTVALDRVPWKTVNPWWFDVRTGASISIGTFSPAASPGATKEFTPPGTPGRGNDWVLVLDETAAQFPAPGL